MLATSSTIMSETKSALSFMFKWLSMRHIPPTDDSVFLSNDLYNYMRVVLQQRAFVSPLTFMSVSPTNYN